MNNSVSIKIKDITVKQLAPVIPLRSLPKDEARQKRKVSLVKTENNQAGFYTKPIYKSKKYDLL